MKKAIIKTISGPEVTISHYSGGCFDGFSENPVALIDGKPKYWDYSYSCWCSIPKGKKVNLDMYRSIESTETNT